tara:strand:+ start:843 stop:1382 length:540 start_codon:yes stop_codon:yes gene_type:complete
MSAYFQQFPKMLYDLKGNDNFKLVPDIFRRIKVRSKMKDNLSMLDKFDIDSGDSPESVAYKVYGNTDYFWVICLLNNIVNRFYDWPLDEYSFQKYISEKYTNPDAIHHYEKPQSSGETESQGPGDYSHMIEVNSTVVGAQAVSNAEYERRIQDEKRQIQILQPQYLSAFVSEFRKLIRK